MNLSPWRKRQVPTQSEQNYSPLFSLQNDINSLFDDWFNGGLYRTGSDAKQAFVPAVDVLQNEKSYQVKAELPGLKEDDIELFIEDGYMVIKGERKDEKKQQKDDYIVHESNYGSFYRSFPLPNDVDAEKNCKASLKDGLLTVELPKFASAKPKKEQIKIKSS